jgi:hypothetical protein
MTTISLLPVRLRGRAVRQRDWLREKSDYGEPRGAWKTDLLAVLLLFAFAVIAVLTFLR